MFQLEKAITDWRASASPSMDEKNLDELEAHLRDGVEEELGDGKSPLEAFAIAHYRLGELRTLSHEYDKSSRLSRKPAVWIALIVAACGAMLPFQARLGGPELVTIAFFGVLFSALYRVGWLLKWRWLPMLGRHALATMTILVTAAWVTPTPDVIVLSMLVVPLWLLYAMAVATYHLLAKITYSLRTR